VSDLRAVVVDDEVLAREGLSADVAKLGVDVVSQCGDARAAIEAIRGLSPDVLFLDIEMPEMNGFELLEQLEPEELPPAIVFVTAYDQHAVRAFEARAMDYLLKPVSRARIEDAVRRIQQRVSEARALRDSSGNQENPERPHLQRLSIRDREGVTIIPVEALEWIEAETYYVRLHATGFKPRLLRERMTVLAQQLDPSKFFRTHRSAIVRLDRVRAIKAISKYEYGIVLASGATAPLSRDRRSALEAAIQQL
jgi:two-component system LytT family response regulator